MDTCFLKAYPGYVMILNNDIGFRIISAIKQQTKKVGCLTVKL